MFLGDLEYVHYKNARASIDLRFSHYIGNIGEKIALKYLIENGFEVISFGACLTVSCGHSKKHQEYFREQIEVAKRYAVRKDVSKEFLMGNEKFLRMWREVLRESKELEKAVKELFGKKWEDFSRFCEAWEEEPDVPSGKTHSRKIIEPNHSEANALQYRSRVHVHRATNWGFDYVAKKGSQIYFVDVKTNKAVLQKPQKKMLMKAKEFGFIPMVVRPKVSIIARLEDVITETF